jgi:hypothetical protein
VARIGQARNRGKQFRKCPLGSPKSRCDDTIKMYLRETGCETGRWMELA